MATNSFSISALYQSAFGLPRGEAFSNDKLLKDLYDTEKFDDLPASAFAPDDTFFQMRYTLQGKNPYGITIFMPMRLGGLQLPNEPSVSIVAKKTIVETGLVGQKRKGFVKELISIDDYEITIRGVALNYASKKNYPEDAVKKLHDLFLRNEALKVECALTALLGIERLVIKEFTLPDMPGVQHAQAYQFSCVSDEYFELEII
jgi:hypothetical protein